MKLQSIGQNQTELEKANGVTVFYSYSTPVAAFVPGKGALVTNKHYSVTTSRHINKAVERWGATRVEVDQGVIDQYADGEGDTSKPIPRPYQPKTGEKCSCKRGVERDNCARCEGTGWVIDFAAIRARA